jgi:hypothetical protein
VRRKAFLAVQLAFAAAVFWFAGRAVLAQWNEARGAALDFRPRWALIALSGLIVLTAYALLIETWRIMVRDWGSTLSRGQAARIWFVSNLGRYLPGKVWQIGAMGMMSERAGVSPIAATGSALVINIVNLVAGAGVVAVTGAGLLGNQLLVAGSALALGAGVLAVPRLVPAIVSLLPRRAAEHVPLSVLPRRPIWIAALASVAAWFLYGAAFSVFARGVTPQASGAVTPYVAAFTASYILGYVTLFAPGGIGVRDVSLAAFLSQLQLAPGATAVMISVASRLWLTVLEVLPGVVYMALGARDKKTPDLDATTQTRPPPAIAERNAKDT